MIDILQGVNLSIGYKKHIIAENINVHLKKGEVTALIGANGIGKSTLINSLTGNLPVLRGKVIISGKDIKCLAKKELAKLISLVSTDVNMAGGLKVEELVSLGRIPYTGMMGSLRSKDSSAVTEAMEKIGIIHKRKSFIGELSDGERQKTMIARAIAQDTPILIMDEPLSFLDVAARIEILLLLKEIAYIYDKAILFSTHEITQTFRMIDNLWLFIKRDDNKMLMEGKTRDLINEGLPQYLFDSKKVKYDSEINDFIVNN